MIAWLVDESGVASVAEQDCQSLNRTVTEEEEISADQLQGSRHQLKHALSK